jgi:hypothetical protein
MVAGVGMPADPVRGAAKVREAAEYDVDLAAFWLAAHLENGTGYERSGGRDPIR